METSAGGRNSKDSSQGIPKYSKHEVDIYDHEICSRSLSSNSEKMKKSHEDEEIEFQDSIYERQLGTLILRDTIGRRNNWNIGKNRPPHLSPNLKFPPILIPSSGRPDSALLDLSNAMKQKNDGEDEDYVQIVVISRRDKTFNNYWELLQYYPHIDIFIIDDDFPQTVGAYRYVCKILAEQITPNNLAFIMDDNILCFKGVTLKNDPNPQFGLEALSSESQRSPISLRNLLEHFTSESLNKYD